MSRCGVVADGAWLSLSRSDVGVYLNECGGGDGGVYSSECGGGSHGGLDSS